MRKKVMADIGISDLNVPSELPWVCNNPVSHFRKVLILPEVKYAQINLHKTRQVCDARPSARNNIQISLSSSLSSHGICAGKELTNI
jgi:hypothetical protein